MSETLPLIAAEVKRIREDAGDSLSEFARKTGVSRAYVWQIERGDRKTISFDWAAKICTAYSLPMDHFVRVLSPGVTVPPPPSGVPVAPGLQVLGLTASDQGQFALPFFDEVPCGPAELKLDRPPGYVYVPSNFHREGRFVIRAKGDSMIGRGVIDGDYLVFNAQETADPGDVVLAIVKGEATVKIYTVAGKGRKRVVTLEPANPKYKSIAFDPEDENSRILGVMLHRYG